MGQGPRVCVRVINLFILPPTDLTESWRQLGVPIHDQIPSPTGDPPQSPLSAQNSAVTVVLPNLLCPMLPEVRGVKEWIVGPVDHRCRYKPSKSQKLRKELRHEHKALAGCYYQLPSGHAVTGDYLCNKIHKLP